MQESGSGEAAVDPWAPGGVMSTTWDQQSGLAFEIIETAPPRQPMPGGRKLLIAAFGALILVIAAVVVERQDDDGSDPVVDQPSPSTPIETGAPPDEPDASAPADVTPAGTPVDAGDSTIIGTSAELDTVIRSSRAPVLSLIDIAPELADRASTEVVALHDDRGLVEVSIPSGRVRETELGFATDSAQLAATDFGALVWPMPGGSYELLSVGGARTFVNSGPSEFVLSTPGLDRFYVWRTTGTAAAVTTQVEWVDALGDRGADQPMPIQAASDLPPLIDSAGSLLVTDTGGTYRTDEQGTQRLTTGDVVATGRNHILLRDCDQQLRCKLSTLDANGFSIRYSTDLPTDADPLRIGGLSPSGRLLLMVGDRTLSVDNPPELQVLDLVDGDRRVLRASRNFEGSAAWATDSSGVFYTDTRLRFIDSTTGEDIVVSDELVGLREVTTRVPSATPTCEVLALALPTFDEMRDADDASIAAPSDEVLNRLADLAPTEVATAIEPLVEFIEAFVSVEQPESRRVANWPADVRAGLDALDVFDGEQC